MSFKSRRLSCVFSSSFLNFFSRIYSAFHSRNRMLSVENTYVSTGGGGGDGSGSNSDGGGTLSKSKSPLSSALSTKTMDLLPVVENKRKFSFPIALHSSSLLGDNNTLSARRRFSNVSDVVTRKLSSTIGWKLPSAIPTQDLVTQGKCLCGQYIRNRLKRSGLFTKKLGLQRLRSIIGTPSAHIVREVFPALNYVSDFLEMKSFNYLFYGVICFFKCSW